MSIKLFNETKLTSEQGKFLSMAPKPFKNLTEQTNMVTLYENTKREMKNEAVSADIASYDTMIGQLLHRTVPNMVGSNLVGVQPMKQPVQFISAMKVFYGDTPAGTETWNANRPDVTQSGTALGVGMATSIAEQLGTKVVDATSVSTTAPVSENPAWGKMTFNIVRVNVEAKSRALKATFTNEFVEDLRALYGEDAESNLAAILQGEISAELDYELLNFVSSQAVVGTTINMTADTDGRWAAERYLGLARLLDRQGYIIGQQTRRGRATFIVTTPDVVGALDMTGRIHNDYDFGVGEANVTGLTYCGKLSGKYDIYIDPYATPGTNFALLGYRGNDYDAGAYYCPYVPLTMYKANDTDSFNPRIGFKTRYGLVHNPYASGVAGANPYFRRVSITNL